MRNFVPVLLFYFGVLIVFVTAIQITIYTFSNPELTQTQVFLDQWVRYVVLICGVICASFGANHLGE